METWLSFADTGRETLERRETKHRGAESGVKGRGQGLEDPDSSEVREEEGEVPGRTGGDSVGSQEPGEEVFPEGRCDHVRGRPELRMTLDLAHLLWTGLRGDCGVKRERETTNKGCYAGELCSTQRLMRWPWGKGISQIFGATILWLADGNVLPRGQQWWAGGSEGSWWSPWGERARLPGVGVSSERVTAGGPHIINFVSNLHC